METSGATSLTRSQIGSSENFLRRCLDSQTIDYLLSKPACFNLLAAGEDGLGKVTLLETLFGVPLKALREARDRVVSLSAGDAGGACGGTGSGNGLQIVTEMLTLQGGLATAVGETGGNSTSAPGDTDIRQVSRYQQTGRLTLRLMTTANYSSGHLDTGRNPWSAVAEYLAKQVTNYVNTRAAHPFDFRPESDERVHCCLFFLPPMGGRGLRRCDAAALKCLDDKVNLVPVLAKADCYSADELAERKSAICADLQRYGIAVHQFLLLPGQQQQQQQQLAIGQRLVAAPLSVIGAPHPDLTRCLPWGAVNVEDERFSDVAALRCLVLEKGMLILRKTTKKFHSSVQKYKLAATLPRK